MQSNLSGQNKDEILENINNFPGENHELKNDPHDLSLTQLDNPLNNPPSNPSPLYHLTKVLVHMPHTKSSTLLSFSSYKITFELDNQEKSVDRRYSNFELLRKALTVLLPFTYIPPAHYKKHQSENNKQFLEFRTRELNIFFEFILQHISILNLR